MILSAALFTSLFVDPEMITNSDLKDIYGYNNVCVLFDYSPSREYTAMVYPLFEYSFFLYVVFDYLHLRLVCKNTDRHYLVKIANVALPIKLTLIAWFRMIFVYNIQQPDVVYGVRGVVGHTLAFFGLQFALILVAFENIMFHFANEISFPRLGRFWTRYVLRVKALSSNSQRLTLFNSFTEFLPSYTLPFLFFCLFFRCGLLLVCFGATSR